MREKAFANFEILWLFALRFSPQNLGVWHLMVGTNEHNVSFLLRKFPAVCYIYGTHLFTVFYSLCARPVVTNQHVHRISM